MTTYLVRRALPADTPTVIELLNSRVAWLRDHGHDQWSERDPARDSAETVKRGLTWLLEDTDSHAVGTMTMTTTADRDFWTAPELRTPSLYLNKLATRPELAGRELGALLLYAGWTYAAQRGIYVLRWDVWRTNEGLQRYYSRLGGQLLRSVDAPGRRSGALFEWRRLMSPPAGITLQLDAPLGIVQRLADVQRHESMHNVGDDPAQYHDPVPDHWHLTNLRAPNLGTEHTTPPEPLTVNPWASKVLLYHAGDQWRAHAEIGWSQPVTGGALDQLDPGHLYRVEHVDQAGGQCGVVITGDIRNNDHPAGPKAPELAASPLSR